jgi:hypothetical protein
MDAVGLGHIDHAIRHREDFFDQITEEGALTPLLLHLLRTYLLCAALYGFVMGSFNGLLTVEGWKFALASMVKVPVLFLLTTVIVLPAIHVSNTLMGMRLRFAQTLALFLSAATIAAFMLAACAPILVFFMLCTDNYSFIKLFNVVIFAVSGLYGILFLLRGVRHLKLFEGSAVAVLRVWLAVWALVGAQMAWILRPFIGVADAPFTLFREQESNFYLNILETLRQMFGG